MQKEVTVNPDIPARISKKNPGMAEKAVFTAGVEEKDATSGDFQAINQTSQILNYLREFLLFTVFVAVATYIALSSSSTSRYFFHEVFAHFLTDSNFKSASGLSITFWDVHILDQIWDYLEKVLKPFMYSSVDEPIAQTFIANLKRKEKSLVVNGNIVVVLPRIRQVRVRNDSCRVPEGFVYVFDSCYSYFNPKSEDRTPFGLETGTLWTYQDETVTKSSPIKGRVSTYSGGGYFMDFSLNMTETYEKVQEMWDNTWIDHGTRAIIIDVVSYTQTDNLFCSLTLLFEIPPSGGVITSADVRVQQLLRYVTKKDFIVLGLEAALLVLIVYFSVDCGMSIAFSRFRHLLKLWTTYDIILYIAGYASMGLGIWRYFVVETHLKGLRHAMDNQQYLNFHTVADAQEQYEFVFGLFTLLSWLRLLKFAPMIRPCAIILRAFQIVRMELLALTLMLLLIIFGFAMFAHVVFGTHVNEFSSIGNSLFTLIALFSGGLYIYRRCEDVRPFLAPIFFVVYIFVIILLFLNWFAATIVYGLRRAYKDFDGIGRRNDVFLKDVVRMCLKKMLLRFGCRKLYDRWEEEDRTKNEVNPYDLIVNLLKSNNFSSLERALFFKRHEINDPTAPLTQNKVDNVIADIQGMNGHYVEIDEHAKVMDQIDKIKNRLEVLDNSLSDMVVKVDVLIDKMKSGEDDAKK